MSALTDPRVTLGIETWMSINSEMVGLLNEQGLNSKDDRIVFYAAFISACAGHMAHMIGADGTQEVLDAAKRSATRVMRSQLKAVTK